MTLSLMLPRTPISSGRNPNENIKQQRVKDKGDKKKDKTQDKSKKDDKKKDQDSSTTPKNPKYEVYLKAQQSDDFISNEVWNPMSEAEREAKQKERCNWKQRVNSQQQTRDGGTPVAPTPAPTPAPSPAPSTTQAAPPRGHVMRQFMSQSNLQTVPEDAAQNISINGVTYIRQKQTKNSPQNVSCA